MTIFVLFLTITKIQLIDLHSVCVFISVVEPPENCLTFSAFNVADNLRVFTLAVVFQNKYF